MGARQSRLTKFISLLGPGLLYAGAAVGVSHLVQSTRAGADYGWAMIWVVILANIIKYPFFEFGPRYAAATGESLLEGYHRTGTWALWLFVLMTISTMFIIQGAVTIVTAGLAMKLLSGVEALAGAGPFFWSAVLLTICLVILGAGHYHLLDRLMKVIMVTLSLTTVAALLAAVFGQLPAPVTSPGGLDLANMAHLFFLVTLIGWMPAPVDIATWHSVWAVAKQRDNRENELAPAQENSRTERLRTALLDFKIGYWGTAFLAACFVGLGALILYGRGVKLSPKGGVFAGQVIQMYTQSLGDWAWWLIAIAAFTTMFSTTLTCFDAFPRTLRRSSQLISARLPQAENSHILYWVWIILVYGGTLFLLRYGLENMKQMVVLATTVSFVTAPAFAILNYMAVRRPEVAEDFRPRGWYRRFALGGIGLLVAFALFFIIIMLSR